MNGKPNESVNRRITGKQTLFATTAVAAAVIAALYLGMPSQNANAAVAPVDESISSTTVQIAPPSFANLIEAVQPAVGSIASSHFGPRRTMPQAPDFELPEGSPFKKFFEEHFKGQIPEGRPNAEMQALGSGFIIDPDGYIVTNNHVIEGAGEITVILHDGTRHTAKVKGQDPKTDLALLKIESPEELPYVRFGDSEKAKVGDWVVAVGNPFGLGGSVSAGIISARGRDIQSGPYDDYLQIDAPINRGNSGGPLFDASGKVVGVNTAIFSPSGGSVGIGFAIPSSMAKTIVESLKENGRVERGWLGVQIQEVTDEIAQSLEMDDARGALIAGVQPDSPAESAGFKTGDVILEFNGEMVERVKDLPRIVAAAKANETVKLRMLRDGKEIAMKVKIGSMPDEDTLASNAQGAKTPSADKLGLALAPLTPETRQRLRLPDNAEGVVIADVERNSPAAREGLRPGDLIKRVGSRKVSSPNEVTEAVKQYAGRKAVLLLISRQGNDRFVAVPLDKA